MGADVSVVIATFGDLAVWGPLAARAHRSVLAQTVPTETIRWHLDEIDSCCLGRARNLGAKCAAGEWLIFLDADDELAPEYAERMLAGSGDVRVPSISVWRKDAWSAPSALRLDPRAFVIGCMIRRAAFLELGGFRGRPWGEDVELWLRAKAAGLTLASVPGATYRIHRRAGSRSNFKGRDAMWRQIEVEVRAEFPQRRRA